MSTWRWRFVFGRIFFLDYETVQPARLVLPIFRMTTLLPSSVLPCRWRQCFEWTHWLYLQFYSKYGSSTLLWNTGTTYHTLHTIFSMDLNMETVIMLLWNIGTHCTVISSKTGLSNFIALRSALYLIPASGPFYNFFPHILKQVSDLKWTDTRSTGKQIWFGPIRCRLRVANWTSLTQKHNMELRVSAPYFQISCVLVTVKVSSEWVHYVECDFQATAFLILLFLFPTRRVLFLEALFYTTRYF
jgi:hypothetical protein